MIHRDIKPANILLHDGKPVIADFGIAIAVTAGGAGRLTETGLSLGTPHYMSPEQASADRKVDRRTDIYSLGATLYEMLVGHPPFEAASTPALMAKILADPPPPTTKQRPTVPANVDAAIRVALAKLPVDRFATAGRFADALRDSGFGELPTAITAPAQRRRALRHVWPLLFAASLVFAWLGWSRPTPNVAVERVNLALPEGDQLRIWGGRSKPFDISPDGRRLVYQNQVGGTSQLFVREMDRYESRALEGTTGARHQFFSPDGRWLAYESGETGRREIFVRPFPDGQSGRWQVSTRGGTSPVWAHSGRELFFIDGNRGLVSQAVPPGATFQRAEQQTLFTIGPSYDVGVDHTYFEVSPDDRRFLIVRRQSARVYGAPSLIVVENWMEEVKARVPN